MAVATLCCLAVLLATACGGGSSEAADTLSERAEPAATTEAVLTESTGARSRTHVVADVIDGDTIALGNGRRVRLLQIDAPEMDECHTQAATALLSRLLGPGTRVALESDPGLDDEDRYGRLLRYVFLGERNVNLVLVKRGAASVWFYRGERGRHAGALLRAARRASAAERGLWGACPGTVLDPLRAVDTGSQRANSG
jgi:endonuclease YncB( thermonuclease family)